MKNVFARALAYAAICVGLVLGIHIGNMITGGM